MHKIALGLASMLILAAIGYGIWIEGRQRDHRPYEGWVTLNKAVEQRLAKQSEESTDSRGDSTNTEGAASPIIRLNSATAAELDALPGIGPTKAQAIITDRNANGKFHSIDELERVKGIGPAMVAKIKKANIVVID